MVALTGNLQQRISCNSSGCNEIQMENGINGYLPNMLKNFFNVHLYNVVI